jgi:hypothetical protein
MQAGFPENNQASYPEPFRVDNQKRFTRKDGTPY